MFMRRILPLIADDIPVTTVIVGKIKKLGYRAKIIEMKQLYTKNEIADDSIEKTEIVVATLGFVEAEITAFTKTNKLSAVVGIYNYKPKLPTSPKAKKNNNKREDQLSVNDTLVERTPRLRLASNDAQLIDVLDIMRSLQPLADKQEATLNKLNTFATQYKSRGWKDITRPDLPGHKVPRGISNEAPLHRDLLRLGFKYDTKNTNQETGWPSHVYSHADIPVAQMEKFAKDNGFKLIKQGDKFRSYGTKDSRLSFTVNSAGMVHRLSHSTKPSKKETKADAGLPPGASPLDGNHHGHVTPAYNSILKSYVKARCMGPGKCPVCQREWEEKFGAPYPNKIISATDKKHGEMLRKNAEHYTKKHAQLHKEIRDWAETTTKRSGISPDHEKWEEYVGERMQHHPKSSELHQLDTDASQHRVAYKRWQRENKS
jgi:hypothetical protein